MITHLLISNLKPKFAFLETFLRKYIPDLRKKVKKMENNDFSRLAGGVECVYE